MLIKILKTQVENTYLQRYEHTYVHCSIIDGGQDMETTKMPFNRELDKDEVQWNTT